MGVIFGGGGASIFWILQGVWEVVTQVVGVSDLLDGSHPEAVRKSLSLVYPYGLYMFW